MGYLRRSCEIRWEPEMKMVVLGLYYRRNGLNVHMLRRERRSYEEQIASVQLRVLCMITISMPDGGNTFHNR
jgi:hypothetical protein